MCFPFLAAQGHSVGDSLCAAEDVELARGILESGSSARAELELPVDLVIARDFAEDAEALELDGLDVPDGWMGLDIGPRTAAAVRRCDRFGGDGVLERPDGRVRARAVRGRDARGRRGGRGGAGDDGRRRRRLGRGACSGSGWPTGSRICRPGGGATLELIEGKALPGSGGIDMSDRTFR